MFGAVLKRPNGGCQATFFRNSSKGGSSRTSGRLDQRLLEAGFKCFIHNNLRVIYGGFDPASSNLSTKSFQPGPLLLGESPRPDLDLLNGIFQAQVALEMIDQLPIPQRLDGLRTEFSLGVELLDLVEQALFHHDPDTSVDPGVDDFSGIVQSQQQRVRSGVFCIPLGLPARDRITRQPVEFQRSDRSAAIIGMDSLCRRRIHLLEFRSQLRGLQCVKSSPNLLVRFGTFHHAREERLDVEIGATNDDRVMISILDIRDSFFCPGQPVIDIEGFVRFGNIQKVMRNTGLFFEGWFGGTDVHAPVDLHGVGDDALPTSWKGSGQRDRQARLAARGRASNQDAGWLGVMHVHRMTGVPGVATIGAFRAS